MVFAVFCSLKFTLSDFLVSFLANHLQSLNNISQLCASLYLILAPRLLNPGVPLSEACEFSVNLKFSKG